LTFQELKATQCW